MSLHKFVKLVASSVPCEKILHWTNVCFSGHAISQLRRNTKVKRFERAMRCIYDRKFWMLQVRKS